MRFFQKLALVATFFLTAQSQAFTPESGIWWNPNESGSGYAIEIQDNFLFVALYVYDAAGNPIWYTAGTTLQGDALFDSDLNYNYNGTCIDCAYTEPLIIIGQRGPITINFITETTATIQFEGAVKNIERFNFILGDETDKMVGEWQAVLDFFDTGATQPFIGDVMLFKNTFIADGIKFVEGCRPENTIDGFCTNFALNNHNITAHFDYATDRLYVTVEDGQTNGTYLLFDYVLSVGLDHFIGDVEVHEEGVYTNIFYPVRGFRTASRSFVEEGVGPSKTEQPTQKSASEVRGLFSMLNTELPSKDLSSLSKEKQLEINKRHEIFDKMRANKRTK